MDDSPERDRSFERLLEQSLRMPGGDGVTDACLDAEMLAAWADGGLSGPVLDEVQAHVADCARCQGLVGALARTPAGAPQEAPRRQVWRWRLAWSVPLAAAAAAVALWVAVPQEGKTPPAPPAAEQAPAADSKTQAPASSADRPQADATRGQEPAAQVRGVQPPPVTASPGERAENATGNLQPSEAAAESRRDTTSSAAAPAARVAAEAQTLTSKMATLNRAADAAGVEIVSPDPAIRWRITGSVVDRSTNGGASWDGMPTGSTAALTAGSAPSTLVCWVVGRSGVVLLSTDGRTWRRVTFPEVTDLAGVRATDARAASVSTVDGRTFDTADGGATWTR